MTFLLSAAHPLDELLLLGVGNVVAYTFTIESTGGNGIVVPNRGFLLNNELTDFNFDSTTHPNRVEGGKRPRSSMSPTIGLRDGLPVLALDSPGGSTILTTVLQLIVDRLDMRASLPDAGCEGRRRRSRPLRRQGWGTRHVLLRASDEERAGVKQRVRHHPQLRRHDRSQRGIIGAGCTRSSCCAGCTSPTATTIRSATTTKPSSSTATATSCSSPTRTCTTGAAAPAASLPCAWPAR